MINKSTLFLSIVLLLVIAAQAQDKGGSEKSNTGPAKSNAKPSVMTGFIVDAACAKEMVGKTDVMKLAEAHTRKCALEENCAPSGYGLFQDGKWHKFNKSSDASAQALIEKSKSLKAIMVDVHGTIEGDTLVVASIKEHMQGKTGKRKGGKS